MWLCVLGTWGVVLGCGLGWCLVMAGAAELLGLDGLVLGLALAGLVDDEPESLILAQSERWRNA